VARFHNKPAEKLWETLFQMTFLLFLAIVGTFAGITLFLPVPYPELESIKLLIAITATTPLLYILVKTVREYLSGIIGEKKVAEELAVLPDDYHVFFNIKIRNKGDIDAVVVGPTGVFAIEVKRFSNGTLYIKDHQLCLKTSRRDEPLSKDPVGQIKKTATFLNANLLHTWVDAVLVLVDCKSRIHEHRGVRILRAKELPSYIQNKPRVLGKKSIDELVERLKNYLVALQSI